jgi:hypothetical protein
MAALGVLVQIGCTHHTQKPVFVDGHASRGCCLAPMTNAMDWQGGFCMPLIEKHLLASFRNFRIFSVHGSNFIPNIDRSRRTVVSRSALLGPGPCPPGEVAACVRARSHPFQCYARGDFRTASCG